jgi:hypothetical protein
VLCNTAQSAAAPGLRSAPGVVNFFMAGTQVVRWELSTMPGGGIYRLAMFHPGGRIIEYFTSTTEALEREQELEAMFLNARSVEPVAS